MSAELPFLPETAANDAGESLRIAGDGLGENVSACICIAITFPSGAQLECVRVCAALEREREGWL